MDSPSSPNPVGKEKKTRRRLRLSCVECTKRRQKCDRKYPCGSCTARNVNHLCRWESVPVARPAPQRPPNIVVSPTPPSSDAEHTIRELNQRIAALENALSEQQEGSNSRLPSSPPTLPVSERQPPPPPPPRVNSNPPQHDLQHTTIEQLQLPSPDISRHETPSAISGSASHASNPPPPPLLFELPYSPFSSPEPFSQPEDDVDTPVMLSPLSQHIYQKAVTLAQISLAHHGEYVGRGSALDALYWISRGENRRFIYARSADSISVNPDLVKQVSPPPYPTAIQQLLQRLPTGALAEKLISGYFTDVNWRFGIPETWFRDAWSQTEKIILGNVSSNSVQINSNWLCLLFSIFVFAPRSDIDGANDLVLETPDRYFWYSLAALRIAENNFIQRPSLSGTDPAAEGTVLGCLAVPLLANHLADRGRVSEAWKLVGLWVRMGESIGLHRDCDLRDWEPMSDSEKILRRRAWWGMIVCDKIYSYSLGRPPMVRKESHDVVLPILDNLEGDLRTTFPIYQTKFLQLCSLVGEAMDKCFSIEHATGFAVHEMDLKFSQWQSHLPFEFRRPQHTPNSPISPTGDRMDDPILSRQRYVLTTYYLVCRMKLHVAFITNKAATVSTGLVGPTMSRKRSRALCIGFATDLIRLQCDVHNGNEPGGIHTRGDLIFERYWTLFDAALILLCFITQPSVGLEVPEEAELLLDHTLTIFTSMANQGMDSNCDRIARIAVAALTPLMQVPGWRLAARQRENALRSSVAAPSQSSVFSAMGMFDWPQPGTSSLSGPSSLPSQYQSHSRTTEDGMHIEMNTPGFNALDLHMQSSLSYGALQDIVGDSIAADSYLSPYSLSSKQAPLDSMEGIS